MAHPVLEVSVRFIPAEREVPVGTAAAAVEVPHLPPGTVLPVVHRQLRQMRAAAVVVAAARRRQPVPGQRVIRAEPEAREIRAEPEALPVHPEVSVQAAVAEVVATTQPEVLAAMAAMERT
jgi:hypothetical protein